MVGRPATDRHRTAGFSLVEALVALAVLAVGMLGGVALLVASLRASREAQHLATAVTLASDLGERIRANGAAGVAYALAADANPPAPDSPCDPDESCDTHARAVFDLHEWHKQVRSALPDAATNVVVSPLDGTTLNVFTIEIRWTLTGSAMPGSFALQVCA